MFPNLLHWKVTDIVGGTVRWKRYLDHLITNLCEDKNMVRDMEPLLLQASPKRR